MAVAKAAKPRERCPLYCTVNHKHGITQHMHLVAEVDVASEDSLVAVNLVRRDQADEVELAFGSGWGAPVLAHMDADEARALRDALNVAVAVLDRA